VKGECTRLSIAKEENSDSNSSPLWAAPFWALRFCSFRAPAHTNLLVLEQLLHNTIAWTCKHAGIESQLMSFVCWGVSAGKAK